MEAAREEARRRLDRYELGHCVTDQVIREEIINLYAALFCKMEDLSEEDDIDTRFYERRVEMREFFESVAGLIGVDHIEAIFGPRDEWLYDILTITPEENRIVPGITI